MQNNAEQLLAVFHFSRLCKLKCVKNSELCVCNIFVVSLLVYLNMCAMLLIVSGNIELNPGPKKCPQCENL